uniref:Uncharacterized protein n=1 Tax=Nelumbo nucifera TaxID=4432 RepID=A0A822YGD8_NELNU|nr:TPA_asm: hypothetical protein HUJ06_010408 [Nelumbo nucifera]
MMPCRFGRERNPNDFEMGFIETQDHQLNKQFEDLVEKETQMTLKWVSSKLKIIN